MAKRIAKWKIDRIATRLTDYIEPEKSEIQKEANRFVEKKCQKYICDEVRDFRAKYPKQTRMNDSLSYHSDRFKKWIYAYPTIPQLNVSLKETVFSEGSQNRKDLEDIMARKFALDKKKTVLQNKIKCTLDSLKSYAKIRDEFPEAYKLLLKIDGDEIPEKIGCDSVEELRAELSKSTTKKQ